MSEKHQPRAWLGLIAWMALVFSASLTGAFVSTQGWYEELHKPSWNPPNWIFGPVWTALYIMMAVAAWRVWRLGGWPRQRGPLTLFMIQWALNALWTPLFFGLHLLGWAFVEILILWLFIMLSIRAFWRVDRIAGALLIPYVAWVSFAAYLNFTLWRLN